ncbi:MAG: TraR/DksA family transcriptional regulator, partial [Kiritimatiellae bacterium]|nr:TraR/DksA family transcriptional regulator [Kiritimatiellia bacterium]
CNMSKPPPPPESKMSGKKPAAKKVPAKAAGSAKKVSVKKAPEKKAPAKTIAPVTESAVDAAKKSRKDFVRKPITVISKKPAKPVAKKPEPAPAFENRSQDLAFAFAESMKKRQREDDTRLARERSATDMKLSRRPTSRAKGQSTMQFSEADLDEFRRRLILLRQKALGQSETLRSIALEQADDRIREDEDGSDAFMRLQNLTQVDSHNKIVQKIDEALQRIADGTYGICEMCGQLIRKLRLMNLPFVHTCMECQTAMESPYGKR